MWSNVHAAHIVVECLVLCSGSRLSWVSHFNNNKETHQKNKKNNRKHGPLTPNNECQTLMHQNHFSISPGVVISDYVYICCNACCNRPVILAGRILKMEPWQVSIMSSCDGLQPLLLSDNLEIAAPIPYTSILPLEPITKQTYADIECKTNVRWKWASPWNWCNHFFKFIKLSMSVHDRCPLTD